MSPPRHNNGNENLAKIVIILHITMFSFPFLHKLHSMDLKRQVLCIPSYRLPSPHRHSETA